MTRKCGMDGCPFLPHLSHPLQKKERKKEKKMLLSKHGIQRRLPSKSGRKIGFLLRSVYMYNHYYIDMYGRVC